MRIRTPADFGALIRDRRIKMGLDQRSLAEKAGVGRQWIVAVERGKARAPIGLILRTLQALDVSLEVPDHADSAPKRPSKFRAHPPVDINQVISSFRKPKK